MGSAFAAQRACAVPISLVPQPCLLVHTPSLPPDQYWPLSTLLLLKVSAIFALPALSTSRLIAASGPPLDAPSRIKSIVFQKRLKAAIIMTGQNPQNTRPNYFSSASSRPIRPPYSFATANNSLIIDEIKFIFYGKTRKI